MNVEVNLLAVLLAAAAAMVIGSIWYSKPVFGKEWIKLVKLDEDKAKEEAVPALTTAAIASLLTAYVLAHVSFLSNQYFKNDFLQDAVTTAFWMWLGFQVTQMVMHGAFEQRRRKLTALNVANQFVTMIAMGLVIGIIGV